MVFPLVQLLGTGLGILGLNIFGEKHFQGQVDEAQQGLDLNKPEDVTTYSARLQRNPMTFKPGMGLLQDALQRAQQSQQFDQGFNNLSAFQQASLDNDRALQEMRNKAQQQFTPQQIGQRQMDLYQQFNKDVGTFRDQATYYDQLMSLISGKDTTPADSVAAITNFVKITDPGSIVSSREGDTIRENATGAAGQLRDMLSKLDAKGLTPETRLNLAQAATSMINASGETARARVKSLEGMAAGNPMGGIPAIPLDFIDRKFLEPRSLSGALLELQQGRQGGGALPGVSGQVIRGEQAPRGFKERLVPLKEYEASQRKKKK